MNKKLTTDQLNRPDIETYHQKDKIPVKIILENIRSRSNIGSIFRSADAFLIEELILTGFTACPPHRDIHKTALGATESVKWRYEPDTIKVVQELKAQHHAIWAIEQTTNSRLVHEFSYDTQHPLVFILGNEVKGVDEITLSRCDGAIEINQFGTKHSLNVAVCAGIIMFHANLNLFNALYKQNREIRNGE